METLHSVPYMLLSWIFNIIFVIIIIYIYLHTYLPVFDWWKSIVTTDLFLKSDLSIFQ